mmetsp:Transcript_5428/g.14687  ORF Transcript_5428/g.14687 Transcript_5428/m.14687 type:complete len:222 (-) Transcript_5428:222-887(-)
MAFAELDSPSLRRRDEQLRCRTALVVFVRQRPAREFHHGIIHALRRLRRCNVVWQRLGARDGCRSSAPAPFLGLFWWDEPVGFLVSLVAQNDKGKEGSSITQSLDATSHLFYELLSPPIEAVQGVRIGDVVHQKASMRSAVEPNAERLESLLPRRVPNLELDELLLSVGVGDYDVVLHQEICADRRLVLSCVLAGRVPIHQRCLADAWISQDNDLECLLLV